MNRLSFSLLLCAVSVSTARPSFAQWVQPQRPPLVQPLMPQALPPPSVSDWGVTQVAFGRAGYKSGYRIGTALSFPVRWTTWPYRSSYGVDAMELAVFTNVERPDIGFRLTPISYFFSFWSDSVFQAGYGRVNLIELGGSWAGRGSSSIEVGASFSVGYSYELSEGIAIRVAELGIFAGLDAVAPKDGDPKPFFDGGAILSTGITFR